MSDISSQLNYYKPSGAAPAGGAAATAAAGMLGGAVLGAIYGFIVYHNPMIYINLVILFILAYLLGTIVSRCIHKFRIRNVFIAVVIGIAAFAAAYAVHWFVYIATVLVDLQTDFPFDIAEIANRTLSLMENPSDAWEFMLEINDAGVWQMTSSSGRDTGFAPRGVLLALVWLAEALVFLYSSVKLPWEEAHKPYSERLDRWMDSRALPVPIAFIDNTNDFKRAAAQGDYSVLITPLGDEPGNAKYATVVLYQDPVEPYVSVENVSTKAKKRKNSTKTKKIVSYLRIPPAVAKNISDSLS
jgi:hypothetical protein